MSLLDNVLGVTGVWAAYQLTKMMVGGVKDFIDVNSLTEEDEAKLRVMYSKVLEQEAQDAYRAEVSRRLNIPLSEVTVKQCQEMKRQIQINSHNKPRLSKN